MYLLDTDHVVILQTKAANECERLIDRMSQHPANAFYVPIVTFHEQMLGWNAFIARAKDSLQVVRGYTRMQDLLEYFRDSSCGKKTERLFWQSGGGFDRNVIEPGTLMKMIDYVHMNPVRSGVVEKAGRMEVVERGMVFRCW